MDVVCTLSPHIPGVEYGMRRRLQRLLVLLIGLSIIGCTGPFPSTSSPEYAHSSSSTAATELDGLLGSMQAAVQASDQDAYLALVDLSDPVFALEHTRWSDDWAGPNPVAEYSLQLGEVVVAGETAVGQLTATW